MAAGVWLCRAPTKNSVPRTTVRNNTSLDDGETCLHAQLEKSTFARSTASANETLWVTFYARYYPGKAQPSAVPFYSNKEGTQRVSADIDFDTICDEVVARAGQAGLKKTNLNTFLHPVWAAQGFSLLTQGEVKKLEKEQATPKQPKGPNGRPDLKRGRNADKAVDLQAPTKKQHKAITSMPADSLPLTAERQNAARNAFVTTDTPMTAAKAHISPYCTPAYDEHRYLSRTGSNQSAASHAVRMK